MTRRSRRFALGSIAAMTVLLTACAGLPTSGDVTVGLPLDDVDIPDITQVAAGPVNGAGPDEIVEGFLDAALTPADGWAIAREFLSPELADRWRPSAEVTIDASAAERVVSSDVEGDTEEAAEGDVQVLLNQVARLDERGLYTELSGDTAVASFEVARDEAGEWRITEAADGIVLESDAFAQVFRRYALHYYDQSWSHLVPDVRWYPRRPQIATTLTQALLTGSPSEWLVPAVRSAFPGDVELARDSVPVSPENVASVELNGSALALDATELSRMRTQLEMTLRPIGVSEVRLLVNGRDLNAGLATVAAAASPGTVLLTESEFGIYLGDEIAPVPGVTPEVLALGGAVRAVDLAVDGTRAAVLLSDGAVYTVSDGGVDQLDARPGLVPPSMDPFGYTWSVPSSSPQALTAWQPDVTGVTVATAFPDASAISQLRVAADGVRIAAVITVGGERWLTVSAIERDENSVPVRLGPTHMVAQVRGTGLGLSWAGEEGIALLAEEEGSRVVLTQDVGGPGTYAAAPDGAVAIAATPAGLRLLDADGVVFAQRGTTWQMSVPGVVMLGTRAGR